MNFGDSPHLPSTDEAEARKIIDAFLDAGHNVIDTADGYSAGGSEHIVGRAVRGKRDTVVISTKAFLPQGEGPNHRGLSRVHLTRALDASLRRLGTDYIDIYYCHQWDPDTPIEETMATLDGFVRSGKVRYLGCSNFTAAQIVEAQWAADRVAGTGFVCLQPQYSLVARSIEAEILPVCRRHGLGAMTWSPLGSGVLAGRYDDADADSRIRHLLASPAPQAGAWARSLVTERSLRIAAEVVSVAAELGTTAAAVALSWVRTRPGVTSVILGPRTLDHLRQHLAGLELELPEAVLHRLDEISHPANSPVNGLVADSA